MPPVLVLMYHAILPDGDDGRGFSPEDRLYTVPRAAFREQMALLEKNGLPVLAPDAVAASPDNSYNETIRPEGVVLTFDDAWPQHASVAAPDLAARGWTAAFFLPSGLLGTPGALSVRDARRLAEDGFYVGAHGATHRLFSTLSDADLTAEMVEAKTRLEEMAGRTVSALSLPGGAADARTLPAARAAGYQMAFGSAPGVWNGGTEELVPRCVIRGGAEGTAGLARLLADPAGELARRRRRAAWLGFARRILGARGYARLHRWAAGGAFP